MYCGVKEAGPLPSVPQERNECPVKPAQSLPWPTPFRGHVWGCRGFPVPTGNTEEPSLSSQKPVMEGLSSVPAGRQRNRDPKSSEGCTCLLCALMPPLARVTEDLVCCRKRSSPCSLPHTDSPTCLCAHEACSSLTLDPVTSAPSYTSSSTQARELLKDIPHSLPSSLCCQLSRLLLAQQTHTPLFLCLKNKSLLTPITAPISCIILTAKL